MDYETNILLEDGLAYFKSDAVIRMGKGLGWPFAAASVFRLLPPRLCDRLYGLIARNRLRLFGTRDTCYLPEPHLHDRFIA